MRESVVRPFLCVQSLGRVVKYQEIYSKSDAIPTESLIVVRKAARAYAKAAEKATGCVQPGARLLPVEVHFFIQVVWALSVDIHMKCPGSCLIMLRRM